METRSRRKKRDMERRPFSELCDDLLVEIISRLPFKSTRRCECVCRRWRDVVSHPDHCKKLPWSTLAGFFYETGNLCCVTMNRHYNSLTKKWCRGIDPSLSFLPEYRLCDIHIEMLDCCNGLLLCQRQKTDYYKTTDYVVCNPATKRWVDMPGTDRSKKVRIARLRFDPVISSHFHVFEFAPADATHTLSLGIYSSKTGLWTHRSHWECPIDINYNSSSAFFKGVLYLSSYNDKVVLVAVDMEGNCRAVPIPMSHGSCVAREVYVSQGQLYWVISSASELSIWALDDSSTKNWTLKHNVSLLQLFGPEDSSHELDDYDVIIHPEYKVIFILCTRFCSARIYWTELKSYDMDSRELHSISDLGYDCKRAYLSYVPLFSRSLADGD